MYEKFRWTDVARTRNRILEQYEPLQPHVLLALARSVDAVAFLDIGANIGAYTVFMSQVPTIGKLAAFEANPATADELERNLALNGLAERVAVHRCALSEIAGSLTFGIVDQYSGANAVLDSAFQEQDTFKRSIAVEAVPLDDILADAFAGNVAVKLDVEGHEAMVIRGGRRTFTANRMLLQVELYEQGREQVKAELESLGYRCLLRIGPDHYYSNIAGIGQQHIVAALEQASDAVIARSHARGREAAGDKPVTLRLPGGIAVQLSGRLARWARKALGRG